MYNIVYIYGLGYQKSNKFNINYSVRNNKKGEFVIYEDDLTDLFYIGSTKDPIQRLIQHTNEHKPHEWEKQKKLSKKEIWIEKLLSDGYVPFLRVLHQCKSEERFEVERNYIDKLFKKIGHRIINTTGIPKSKVKNRINLEPLKQIDHIIDATDTNF